MSRAVMTIHGVADRQRVAQTARSCPPGTRVEFKVAKRTTDQNSRMWAMLTDVAQQKEHCGRRYPTTVWKCIFMSALGQEMVFVPSLDGSGVIPLGHRSSDLSKAEMSELMEFIAAWGAQNGVVFHDDQQVAA